MIPIYQLLFWRGFAPWNNYSHVSYSVIWGMRWRWQVFPESKYLLLHVKKIKLCLKCQHFALSVRFILFGLRYLAGFFCTSDWKFYTILKINIFPSICRCGLSFEGKLEIQQELHLLLSVLWWHHSKRPEISQSSSSTKWKLEWFSWRVVLSPWPLCQKHFAPSAWWLFSWRHFFSVEFRKWITCAWISRVLLRSWTPRFSEWLQLEVKRKYQSNL